MFTAPVASRPPRTTEVSEGYLLSSLDLRSGLEVRVLAASLLPMELWRELQRLQQGWSGAGLVAG